MSNPNKFTPNRKMLMVSPAALLLIPISIPLSVLICIGTFLYGFIRVVYKGLRNITWCPRFLFGLLLIPFSRSIELLGKVAKLEIIYQIEDHLDEFILTLFPLFWDKSTYNEKIGMVYKNYRPLHRMEN